MVKSKITGKYAMEILLKKKIGVAMLTSGGKRPYIKEYFQWLKGTFYNEKKSVYQEDVTKKTH